MARYLPEILLKIHAVKYILCTYVRYTSISPIMEFIQYCQCLKRYGSKAMKKSTRPVKGFSDAAFSKQILSFKDF